MGCPYERVELIRKRKGFLFLRTKQTVCNNEVSVLSGCPYEGPTENRLGELGSLYKYYYYYYKAGFDCTCIKSNTGEPRYDEIPAEASPTPAPRLLQGICWSC